MICRLLDLLDPWRDRRRVAREMRADLDELTAHVGDQADRRADQPRPSWYPPGDCPCGAERMAREHDIVCPEAEYAAPITYVAHLPRDPARTRTVCGAPWPGWQAPAGADRRNLPAPWRDPRARDIVTACGACIAVATEQQVNLS